MISGDYTLTPSGPLGGRISVGQHEQRFLREFVHIEGALAFIQEHMNTEKFWPNIWWISDHGNVWQIDTEGKEIKQEDNE